MRVQRRIASILVGATALVLLPATYAQANRLEIANAGEGFRFFWSTGSNELEFKIGTSTVRCEVRLIGTFSGRTIIKRAGTTMGVVNVAQAINICSGGAVRMLEETLPWTLRYVSFTGTLPRISTVKLEIVGFRARITPEGAAACLATSEAARPVVLVARVEASEPTFETITPEAAATIPVTNGEGGPCALGASLSLGATGTIGVREAPGSLQIRLI